MSTREIAYTIVDKMTDEQLENFVKEYWGFEGVPNDETLEAMEECEYILQHPEEYKSYTNVQEMFEDILNEED
jgi:flagellar motor switch protein FliG